MDFEIQVKRGFTSKVERFLVPNIQHLDCITFQCVGFLQGIDSTVEANLRAELVLANERIKELERGNRWKKGR